MSRVYLDANATTPLDPRVREEILPWLGCGNASSPHLEGRAARDAIDRARQQVAELIGARPGEICFTSGATEANAVALLGAVRGLGLQRALCTAVEHPAVLRTLQNAGSLDLVEVPVDARGVAAAPERLPEGVGLVSVMLANNETGAIQPVRRFAELARAAGALVHTDAVQACGKIPVDVHALDVDMLTLSAHKMHGPKGAGALFVRAGVEIPPLYHGGEHEHGLRPGTENVAAIVGLGAAADLALRERQERDALWRRLGDGFLAACAARVPDAKVHLAPERLSNTYSITFPDVEGEAVLLGLDLEGIAVATGSACSSGAAEPSHVLQAMGLGRDGAERSIRVSMHAHTSDDDVERCVTALARVVKGLRALGV